MKLIKRDLNPWLALLLSAFILPGLGQILTGRILRGAIMAGSLLLWLPWAIIKVGLDMQKVLPELTEKAAMAPLTFSDIQAALSPMHTSFMWIFIPLLVVWFYSVTDSLLYIIATRKAKQ